MTILTSKLGLKFSISLFPKPAEDGVVFFTEAEIAYIKKNKLTPEEFRILWNFKKEDYTYDCIPDIPPPTFLPEKELSPSAMLAQKYAPGIKRDIEKARAK